MTRRSSSARMAWSTAQPECRCGSRYDIFSASPRRRLPAPSPQRLIRDEICGVEWRWVGRSGLGLGLKRTGVYIHDPNY
jgi:hypothetical protein